MSAGASVFTHSIDAGFAVASFAGGGVDFEALARSGPRAPRVPNRAGLNQFSWNGRYPDAATFQGLIMWAGSLTGPVAPPGTYTVRMLVDSMVGP